MDHEVVRSSFKNVIWLLNSSRTTSVYIEENNVRVIMELEVLTCLFLGLYYPLSWSNGFFWELERQKRVSFATNVKGRWLKSDVLNLLIDISYIYIYIYVYILAKSFT